MLIMLSMLRMFLFSLLRPGYRYCSEEAGCFIPFVLERFSEFMFD